MTQHFTVNQSILTPSYMKQQQHGNTSSTDLPPYNRDRRITNRTPPPTTASAMRDKHNVYTETLLVGPSIINASPPKNNHNVSLPSMNEFLHNQNENRSLTRDHPPNHNTWFTSPPYLYISSSSSTPVLPRRSMVSNSPIQQQQQFITSSDTFVRHDSRTTPTTTMKSRPLKRQRTITPPNTYILPRKKNEKEKQQCHSCQSTETPEWRKGPLGPRTLCNACGLIWTKLCKQQEEGDKSRRKFKNTHSSSSTAAISPSTTSITATNSPVMMEDCNTSGYCSSSCSSSPSPTLKKNSNDSKKKLNLSFLLS